MSSVNLPPPPSALSGPDKEHLSNASGDRSTPTPGHRKGQSRDFTSGSSAQTPQPQQSKSTQPRNLPVKRYDGDPLGRADVQHAMLCYLFSDTRRVFTNPRPGDRSHLATASGSASTAGAGVACPVWPYGASPGCLRRSDETEEEFKTWTDTKARYDKWRSRMNKKERRARKAAQAEAGTAPSETDTSVPVADETDELADPPAEPTAAKEDDDVDDDPEPLDENEFVQPGTAKLTFKELYLESLLNSGKCTKSMRDKILIDEEYAEDFAKVCLLVNVGRINTTLAFYPEMKTVLRSYHPLPCVQNNENTRRNMQDAPRMKSLLKAVLIDTERPGPPTAGPSAGQPPKPSKPNALSEEAPADFREVIKRYRSGTVPPTSVVTLIFLLSLHANEVTENHFEAPHDSHSLFYPNAEFPLMSKQRAKAFLWLLYHYLEGPAAEKPAELPNPFDDETSIAAAKLAREAYDGLSPEQQTKRQNQPWRGIINPAWQKWKEAEDSQKPDADENTPKATQGESETASQKNAGEDSIELKKEDDDGDILMEDLSKPTLTSLAPEPISHTHRLLVPTLQTVSPEEAATENVDTEEEIRWGKHMQSERATFLAKFQEEEAAKNTAGSPAPSTGTASGKGRKSGPGATPVRRDDTDRGTPSDGETSFSAKNKKRPMGGGVTGPSDLSKRSRMASPIDLDEPADMSSNVVLRMGGKPASPELLAKPSGPAVLVGNNRIRASLWDLDLSIPPNAAQLQESLPRLAWSRILERAQRGVGDACYESDEEDFADHEARQPERARGEVFRILRSLREVIREDIFEEDNRLLYDEQTQLDRANASRGAVGEADDSRMLSSTPQRNGL